MTPITRGILIAIATYCLLVFFMGLLVPTDNLSSNRLAAAIAVIILSSIAAGIWVWWYYRRKPRQ